ncbi:MAG TPA: hypothetical protein VMQ62_13040 [Dongiaceae bacterium]|nr:hypothetical protein [Dongiaceae bacterium]
MRDLTDEPDEVVAAELEAAIEAQIDDAIEAAAAFQPGHAFCHRCEAAICEHSRPPSSRHVFLGYAPTGAPRWMEFAQYALETRHPQFDRLWDASPAFITVALDRADVHGALLGAFRHEERVVLGQILAGFFTLPARPAEGRGVLALTFQAVASMRAGGKRRLGLNLLGTAPGGEDLKLLWERQDDLPWRRAVRWAQSSLMSAARETRPKDDAALEARAGAILQGLARRLEQDVRGRSRRTAHAGERHEDGTRPTRKAIDDIRGAAPEAFLRDDRTGTFVVLGDRGRTHFLTAEGRLVSSVRYSREAIDRKRQHGVWRPLERAEVESARAAALNAGRGDDGDPGAGQGGPGGAGGEGAKR